jgi:hypothetical protein
MMTDVPTKLTVDEAVAEFSKLGDAIFGSAPSGQTSPTVPETFEQAEARRFRFAEDILSLVCPDPRQCEDHRCRRNRACRHFVEVHAVQRGERVLAPGRRSPGAWAVRHAIWVFMNADRG